MKMIIVIVKDNDADKLTQALTAENFRVTRIASTGGFLRSGVVTLLIGVEDENVDAAIGVMRGALGAGAGKGEKRATLFVVPVERFEQV
ncbi:MAG: cyclic-di-AMP receptor [Chloroflexota bacterium]